MDLIRILKLFIAVCILAFIFGTDSFFVYAYTPILPVSLRNLDKEVGRKKYFVPNDSRIVGGKPAVHGEFPYQASIQKISLFGTKTHFCGGAIATSTCVVTAAHCLEGRNENDILVRVGTNTLRPDSSAKELTVKKINVHPEYNSDTIQHDIGVIMLKTPITFKVNVNKVPLPAFKSDMTAHSECLISGWGSTKEGGTTSRSLMYATVPIMTDDKCRDYYGKSEIFETMICAGYRQGGIDSCQGDSGGPMVCSGQLTGVVSWGVGCARPSFPGVYTQVSYYTKWIESLGCFEAAATAEETSNNSFFSFLWMPRNDAKKSNPLAIKSNQSTKAKVDPKS